MKRAQRATHRLVVQFDGQRPWSRAFLSAQDAEDAARRQREIVGPNGERCTARVEPVR